MLSLDQAAKYLIVAWVKDWGMRTLLEVLDGAKGDVGQSRIEALTVALPFMPKEVNWYIANRGAGVSARHFIADAYPRLNDTLWSAKDHTARLALSPQIGRLKCAPVKVSSRLSREDRLESSANDRAMRQERTSYAASREAFKTNQRSAWNVCKG